MELHICRKIQAKIWKKPYSNKQLEGQDYHTNGNNNTHICALLVLFMGMTSAELWQP